MKTKNLILNALLLSIGLMLHQFAPPIFGMKPDFLLSMMFITIFISKDYKMTVIIGAVSGILTALTTTFPGGQIPNFIDKIITSNLVYLMILFFERNSRINNIKNSIKIGLLSASGTLVSGTVFLFSANLLFSLPASFNLLFITVVIPSILINTVSSVLLFKVMSSAAKRTGLSNIL
ncbi:tryptophan transporter [Clostridium polynesiense]|uniref:tryptophan transporter n=1 Tax=Clostridium polynesiense TaxID=1325933 RepID=UPI00059156B7|nr:tryptophan transporter [Clostridium polynesiense]